MSLEDTKFKEVMKDDEDLAVFLRAMARFDRNFCDLMSEKKDFTLQIEIRADAGRVVHSRVHSNVFDRPKCTTKKDYA